jgi:hypothetical protein
MQQTSINVIPVVGKKTAGAVCHLRKRNVVQLFFPHYVYRFRHLVVPEHRTTLHLYPISVCRLRCKCGKTLCAQSQTSDVDSIPIARAISLRFGAPAVAPHVVRLRVVRQ